MLNLCICDDSPTDLRGIAGLVKQFAEKHPEMPVRVSAYQDPFALLEKLDARGGYDVYLLDVLMPHLPGIELARHIRERGEAAEILFLTESREYALEAFGVSAGGYLLKPVGPSALEKVLLPAAGRLLREDGGFLLLKTPDGVRRLLYRELLLVESFNQRRVCTLAGGGQVTTAETLSSLKARLAGEGRFFSPHRAYLVNLEYVAGFTAKELYLPGDRRIPIARKRYAPLKGAYLEYVFSKGRGKPGPACKPGEP